MTLSIIVLAGGQGSRIRPVLGNTPKLLAKINDVPFINYLLRPLSQSLGSFNYQVFIATGFGHDQIRNYISLKSLSCTLIQEKKPLGTLGAAANAAGYLQSKHVLVVNGDTLFECNLHKAYRQYLSNQPCPMAIVKASQTNERYGGYSIDADGHHLVTAPSNSDLISMGALFTTRASLIAFRDIAIKAGISKPMMDDHFISKIRPLPFILPEDSPFIDIGTPSSYAEAHAFLLGTSFKQFT